MSSETKKEPSGTKHKPLKVIRRGAIAASIWRRQTPTGFEYLDFSLSRSWKLKSGEREGYSQSFFEGNEEAIADVVKAVATDVTFGGLVEDTNSGAEDIIATQEEKRIIGARLTFEVQFVTAHLDPYN